MKNKTNFQTVITANNENVAPAAFTSALTSGIAEKARTKIIDKTYIKKAYVLEYRDAERRCARLAEMGKTVSDEDKKLREVRVVIEGKPMWAKTKMGNIFPGSRIWASYLKDENGDVVKMSIVLSREEPQK